MSKPLEDSDSDEDVNLIVDAAARKPQKPLWRRLLKWVLLTVAMVLVAAMLVQLFQNYKEVITERVFPPRLTGAGRFCPDGPHKSYRMHWQDYANGTMHIEVPDTDVFPLLSPPRNFSFHEDCLTIVAEECVSVVLYTI